MDSGSSGVLTGSSSCVKKPFLVFARSSVPFFRGEAGVAGGRARTTWSYSTRQVREEAAEVISGVGPQCPVAGNARIPSRSAFHEDVFLPGPSSKVQARHLLRCGRPGPRGTNALQFHTIGTRCSRISLLWGTRGGQDHGGSCPGKGLELLGTGRDGAEPVQQLLVLSGDCIRNQCGRPGNRRSLPHVRGQYP